MPDDTPEDFIDFSPPSKLKARVTEEKFTHKQRKCSRGEHGFLPTTWQLKAGFVNMRTLGEQAGALRNKWNTTGSMPQLESELTA